jgi:anti-sigma factor RsiW
MNTLHPLDLLAAYALDALTDDERLAVDAHLISCVSCRREVARHKSVTEVLEMATMPDLLPSADLRERILRASARTPQVRPVPVRTVRSRRISLSTRLGGWLAAAILLVTSVGLGAWDLNLRQQVQALTARPTTRVALAATSDAPGAVGDLAIDAGRGTLITVGNLPQLTTGLVYEAWVIDDSGAHAAGTFLTTADGRGTIALTRPAGLGQVVAITTEPSPGVDAPTGKILLKGTALATSGT